jgi:hypothetical protein
MGKKTLGRPRRRWKNCANIGLKIKDGAGLSGLMWLRIERWETVLKTVVNLGGFHKLQGIS